VTAKKDNTLSTPKRGAIPTPKSEIEKATPYIPETELPGESAEPSSEEGADPKELGKKSPKVPNQE